MFTQHGMDVEEYWILGRSQHMSCPDLAPAQLVAPGTVLALLLSWPFTLFML